MNIYKMKKNLIYNESIKIINNFYDYLEKINSLPNVEVFKIKINNKYFFYSRNNDKNENIFKIIKKEEFDDLKNKIKERKKIWIINKKAEIKLRKNIKILSAIDKELANIVKNEFFIYNLDKIPVSERNNFIAVVVKRDKNFNLFYKNEDSLFYNFDNKFKEVFENWVKGKIKAKEIQNFITKKILN